MSLLSGLTISWGMSVADLFMTVVDIIASVNPFILLGIALTVTPVVIQIIKRSVA